MTTTTQDSINTEPGERFWPHPLYDLTQAVAAATRPEEVFEAALVCLERSLGVQRASVLLFDPDGVMRFKAWRGLSDGYRAAVEGHSPWAPDEQNAQPVLVPDLLADESLNELQPTLAGERIRACAFIPLTLGTRLLGKFMLYYAEPHVFDPTETLIAQTIGAHVAFAIDQQAHRESEKRYRDLIESIGVAIYTTDANGRITYYNEDAAKMWGRRPALNDDLWCGSWKLYWSDGRPMAHDECPMALTLREGRPARGYDAVAERPDGSRINFIPYPTPLFDASGRLLGAINVLIDITDQKRAEAALHEKEQRLTQALGETKDVLAARDETIRLHELVQAQLASLIEASGALIDAGTREEDAVGPILQIASTLLGADAHAIWQFVEERDQWEVAQSQGLSGRYLDGCVIKDHGGQRRLLSPMVIEDVATENQLSGLHERYVEEGIASILVAPLRIGQEVEGTLTFYYRTTHRFSDLEVRLGSALANLAAASMTTSRLLTVNEQSRTALEESNGRLERAAHELSRALIAAEEQRAIAVAIGAAGGALATELDVDAVLQSVTDIARSLTGAQLGAFFHAPDGGEPALQAVSGGTREMLAEMVPANITEMIRTTLSSHESMRASENDESSSSSPARSYLVAPVLGHVQEQLGALVMAHPEPDVFGPREEQILAGITRWAAIAMDNARLYQEMARVAADLRVANAAKDEFLGLVSHELKTPLTTIRGNAGVLAKGSHLLDEEMRTAALGDIVAESERLHRIIENLLLLARAEQGQPLDTEPLLVVRVVEKVLERHRQQNPHRTYQIIEHSAPKPVVFAETSLEQVTENLISNAEKYSPPGEPIVIEFERRSDEVEMKVLDRGPGIDAAEAERIFDPFYRTSGSRSRAQGLGIGLAVCKRLIEAHGGRIWARPRDDGGSEFGFVIPLAAHDQIEMAASE